MAATGGRRPWQSFETDCLGSDIGKGNLRVPILPINYLNINHR